MSSATNDPEEVLFEGTITPHIVIVDGNPEVLDIELDEDETDA